MLCPSCQSDQIKKYQSCNDMLMISRLSHLVFDMVAFSCLRCGVLWYVIGGWGDESDLDKKWAAE